MIDAASLGLAAVGDRGDGAAASSGSSDADTAVRLPAELSLDQVARRYAAAALDHAGGNRSAAARSLGISRNRLARLLADDDAPT